MKGKIMESTVQDPTFGVNNFQRPKVLSITQTYANNLLTILLGKPGFYPSQPTLGMDISQYLYKYIDDINVNEIKSKLINQCNEFMPEIESGEFEIYKTEYSGRPMLLFRLPIVIDNKTLAMALGITINEKGEMIYNFVEDKQQYI